MSAIPRRFLAGVAFVAAGALLAGGLIAGAALLPVGPWPYVLAWLAIGTGFVALALASAFNPAARVALAVGAAGWALYALAGASLGLPAELALIAAPVAAVGGLIGAIVLFAERAFAGRLPVAFLATMVVSALFVLGALGVLTGYVSIMLLLFAAGLIVTGVLLMRGGTGSQASSPRDAAS